MIVVVVSHDDKNHLLLYYSHFFSFSFKREKRCAYSATLIMKE